MLKGHRYESDSAAQRPSPFTPELNVVRLLSSFTIVNVTGSTFLLLMVKHFNLDVCPVSLVNNDFS